MDKATFNEYLEKRYYEQLSYYDSSSKKNQKRYKNIQWILIILSTVTTILAALPKTELFDFKYLIVISAALVTILTSGLKTFQYQELWISYRSAMEQLKPEIYYYNFGVGDYGKPGTDKECLFVTRVEQILSKEHTEWPAVKNLKDQQTPEQDGSQSANEGNNKETISISTPDKASPLAAPDAIRLQDA